MIAIESWTFFKTQNSLISIIFEELCFTGDNQAECLLKIQTHPSMSRVEPFYMKEQRGLHEQIFTKGKG